MKVYKYTPIKLAPHAPLLDVMVRNTATRKEVTRCGKIDSGADLVILPVDGRRRVGVRATRYSIGEGLLGDIYLRKSGLLTTWI